MNGHLSSQFILGAEGIAVGTMTMTRSLTIFASKLERYRRYLVSREAQTAAAAVGLHASKAAMDANLALEVEPTGIRGHTVLPCLVLGSGVQVRRIVAAADVAAVPA